MKSLSGMGRSTIRGGTATDAEVTASLPKRCLGTIEYREKLSEFETEKMKRFNF